MNLLSPEVAGPNWWFFIHIAPRNITNIKQAKIYKFFICKVLKTLFPCEVCRCHIISNIRKLPSIDDYLLNKKMLQLWSFMFHNEVNKMLKKPVMITDKAYEIWDRDMDDESYFLVMYYILHSSASTVSYQNASKKYFNLLVYGIIPSLGDKRFVKNYCNALKSITNIDNISKKNLVQWTIELRNLHRRDSNLPERLNMDIRNHIKFSEKCLSCTI